MLYPDPEGQKTFQGYPWYTRLWHFVLLFVEPASEFYDIFTDLLFIFEIDKFNTANGITIWESYVAMFALITSALIVGLETVAPCFEMVNPCNYQKVHRIRKDCNKNCIMYYWTWSCWFSLNIHRKYIINQEITEEDHQARRGSCANYSSGRHGVLLFLEDIPQLCAVLSFSARSGINNFVILQKLIVGIVSGSLKAKTWIYG